MEQWVVWSKTRLVVLGAVLLGLAGCSSLPNAVNPISWYRDLTGASKNDDLGKNQNQQNLQEGSNEPYPNLGNVPAEPDTALSSVDRDKLVNSLIADRNNAEYSTEDLRPGRTAITAPPPPAPTPPAPVPANETPPPAAPQTSSSSSETPPASAPAAQPAKSSSETPTPPASTQPAPAPPPAQTAQNASQHSPARGSEAPPAESSLQSPTVRSTPRGEAVTPAPPPPQIPPPQAEATPEKPAAPPTAAPKANRSPQQQQAAAPATTPKPEAGAHRPTVSYRIADVTFPTGSALLSDKRSDIIARIVKLHNENGGTIRIVGYGEAAGGNAAVTGLNLALDRAQAVAVALTDRGVPAEHISVEAAPVAASGGRDVPRAEVYLEN
jgi:outer membrane protein OmpA-like peptidoglycan-associated protein